MILRQLPVAAAIAILMLTAGTLPGQASANPTETRVTAVGGINLVPTPSGLGLANMVEQTVAGCSIGAGCAARTWKKLVGPDANNPEQVISYESNVGVLPTVRLARRDQRALKEQFQTFVANSGFKGTISLHTSSSFEALKISGYFDQTLDDHVRLVQVRQGTRTVFIAASLDNRLVQGTLPAKTTVAALAKKAKAVFRASWAQVPSTILP
ncbi:MAG: hypothetical protein WCP28_16545 [Actinomycetes bacterium]